MKTQRITLMAAVLATSFILFFSNRSVAGAEIVGIPSPTPAKVMTEYRGVPLGMSADTVRTNLGKPKDASDEMDLYLFGENESVQFFYDKAKLVRAMLITFSGDIKAAPVAKDVFGEEIPANEDGSIFKMVRFEKAGYWISYSRSGGGDQVITIAMQKI